MFPPLYYMYLASSCSCIYVGDDEDEGKYAFSQKYLSLLLTHGVYVQYTSSSSGSSSAAGKWRKEGEKENPSKGDLQEEWRKKAKAKEEEEEKISKRTFDK